jgi:hypothetical protein
VTLPRQVLGARHRSLPEIGDRGLTLLAEATVTIDGALSPAAASIARAYLERAGVTVVGEGGGASEAPALAHLRGAHFALEATARIVGVRAGAPAVPLEPLLAAVTIDGARDGR